MAKARKLKVFRTPIGFHDAYVAAPSQKAALEAWGSDTNLFAAGAAELVTDPKLAKAALERPGEVVKVLRGGGDEPTAPVRKARSRKAEKPSREALDKAETALGELDREQRAELRDLAKEEERLASQRRATERRHKAEHGSAEAERDRAKANYERAVRRWDRSG